MTDDELRQACEKLARQVCDYSFCDPRHIQTTKDDNVAILLRFARQQQAVGWREAGKVSNGKYCEAKAKELEA